MVVFSIGRSTKFIPNTHVINDSGIKILDIIVNVFIILLALMFWIAFDVSAMTDIFS